MDLLKTLGGIDMKRGPVMRRAIAVVLVGAALAIIVYAAMRGGLGARHVASEFTEALQDGDCSRVKLYTVPGSPCRAVDYGLPSGRFSYFLSFDLNPATCFADQAAIGMSIPGKRGFSVHLVQSDSGWHVDGIFALA